MDEECARLADSLTALVFDRLEDRERERVLSHLARCRNCGRELERLRALRTAAEAMPRLAPPSGFTGRVMRAVALEEAFRSLSAFDRVCLTAGSLVYRARRSPAARTLLLAAAVQLVLFTLLYFASGLTVQVAPSPGEGRRVIRVQPIPGSEQGPSAEVEEFLPEEGRGRGGAPGARLDPPALVLKTPKAMEPPLPETALQRLDARIERENRIELSRCRMDARFIVPLRRRALEQRGGDRRTAAAVKRGLRWLREHQREDGSWPAGGLYGGDPRVTPGITALGAEAFLSDGHTERAGRYAPVVERALAFLLSGQDAWGRFGWVPGAREESLFNQSTAVLALSENYILCEGVGHEGALARGIRALVEMSGVGGDGSAEEKGDAAGSREVYGAAWTAMALRTAAVTGLPVNGLEAAAARAQARVALLAAAEERDRGGEGGRLADHPPLCTVTTLALDALFHEPSPRVETEGTVPFPDPSRPGTLFTFLEDPDYREPAFLFFTGTALCEEGDAHWNQWNRRVKMLLLGEQGPEGLWSARGRWPWIDGGDLYTTALDLLTLQVYYRYVRLEENGRR